MNSVHGIKRPPPGVFRQIVFSGNVNLFHGIKRPPHFFSGECFGDEEEGRWHFRAQGPFAGVGIAVDLRGVNQTWEGPKPMFAAKLLKIHFA